MDVIGDWLNGGGLVSGFVGALMETRGLLLFIKGPVTWEGGYTAQTESTSRRWLLPGTLLIAAGFGLQLVASFLE